MHEFWFSLKLSEKLTKALIIRRFYSRNLLIINTFNSIGHREVFYPALLILPEVYFRSYPDG